MRGINTKAQLAETEAALQQRLRKAAMDAGVTLVAPETVFLAADTKFGRDVVVEPYVVFGPGVTVEDNAVIRSFSHLDRRACRQGRAGRSLMRGCGRARSSARTCTSAISSRSRRPCIEDGAKANHLAYIGDARRRRRRQYRRRHHHLQLRRHRQAPHRHRQGRVHRLEFGAGRAGHDRRRRLCRLRLGDHPGRAGGRAGARARAAGR